MIIFVLPLKTISFGTMKIANWNAIWLYYHGVVIPKRRLLEQPMWQEHDWQIGVPPPPEILEEKQRNVIAAMAKVERCEACGQFTGPIPCIDATGNART